MSSLSFLIENGWAQHVDSFAAGRHTALLAQVAALRTQDKSIYPEQHNILQAFTHTAWDDVRVLILGQDPYHGKGQAHGLAFSVPHGTPAPPSLRNILKEVARDTAQNASPSYSSLLSAPPTPPSPNLIRWARQGVLLLNTVLTVEDGKAHSHATLGWQELTSAVVQALAARPQPLAALLWGNAAKACLPLFTNTPHLVLLAAHPSPLSASRGFNGCGHFTAVNTWLKEQGQKEILW